ncbi:hypothetical protein C0989_004259 [Termitomyces sp. Mn162]|nr:hypothetical protein C0989_004259 [Termitomyces sp. Mn162]
MQDREVTVGDPLQPRQSFYGGQNITYNSFQGSHLSPAAATHHSSSHNVNPTTRAQQLYAAVVNSSLGSPLSPRSNISAGSLPASSPSLPPSSAIPSLSSDTRIMSGMYQPQPLGSSTSQLHYQYQRESSLSLPDATPNPSQGPVAMDAVGGLQPLSVYPHPFPQPQPGQTATLNVDAFDNSADTTRSRAFYAEVNAGGQIGVASLPVHHSQDSLNIEHTTHKTNADSLNIERAAHKTKALSGKKIGKASKNLTKFALKMAGSAVEIATGVPVPREAIVSSVDVIAGIINRLGLREKNSPKISRADLEAVCQGAPNAKYEEIIRALMMAQVQQRKAEGIAPPGFCIQVVIDELRRVQALANRQVPPVSQHSSIGPTMGLQSGSMGPALVKHVQPMQPQIQPNIPSTHATMALTIPEHGIYAYASGPGVESSHNDTGPARLPAEFMQQQVQLQTTLLQQREQITLLQEQQQQFLQFLLEQQKHNQEIREERKSGAEFCSRAFVGSRPGSRNEVTSLPLHLT